MELLRKTSIEFHWLGPGTKLKKLDKIAKQCIFDYARAKNLQDKWKGDTKMIVAINKLPGKKNMTAGIVCKIMKAKKTFKYCNVNKNVFNSKTVCLDHCTCVSYYFRARDVPHGCGVNSTHAMTHMELAVTTGACYYPTLLVFYSGTPQRLWFVRWSILLNLVTPAKFLMLDII